MAAAPSLAQQVTAGTNPLPFALALVALGAVMLAFPRAAVPLAVLIVLGALLADRQALAAFNAFQAQKGH